MDRFSESGHNNAGGLRTRTSNRRRVGRWALRLALLLVLSTALTLSFGSGGFNSEARFDSRTPAQPAAPPVPKLPAVTTVSSALPPPPVTVPQAAANAALELAGSGDDSVVAWFPGQALWGIDDAPPGSPIGWNSPYWWQSALDLRALVRYLEQTHNTSPYYESIIERTFAHNVRRPGSRMPINFGNEFMDDTAWWGLAWLEAARYELNIRHDVAEASRFMRVAEWDANDVWSSPRTCGQGIVWQRGEFPPDTITNDEFATLAAELAQAQGQPGPWFDPAAAAKWTSEAWRILWWLQHTRLINVRTGHVYDGFGMTNGTCRVSDGGLTYTQGQTADALVQMGLATGQQGYLVEAKRFIDYALSPVTNMTYRGVVQEPCEATPGRCDGGRRLSDSTVWKSLLVDAAADWRSATHSTAFDSFLATQAQAVIDHAASNGTQLTHCQTPHDCQFTFYWSRPVPPNATELPVGPGSQEAGLSALTDALSASPGFTG